MIRCIAKTIKTRISTIPVPPLPRFSSKVASNPSPPNRIKFENEHHLGRALSKFEINSQQRNQWRKKVKSNRKWEIPSDGLFPQNNYEHVALQQIHQRSFQCNVLLEIRDVRVPASSHHPSFTRLAKHRLHLICYTHADMIDSATRDRVEEWTKKGWPGSHSIFVDTREGRKDLQYDLLYDTLLEHLDRRGGDNTALTVGVANTGKSSVLMALIRTARARGEVPKKKLQMTVSHKKNKKRKLGKAQPIGIQDKPGKTREITEYLLRDKPRLFFLDVPGMTPMPAFFSERPEAWFAFGAANLMPVHKHVFQRLDIQMSFCEFVLHAMNRDENFGYVVKLGLKEATNDITTVLEAVKRGKEDADQEVLMKKRCATFLKLFNTGNFGPVILDDIRKPYRRFIFEDKYFKKDFVEERNMKSWDRDVHHRFNDDERIEDDAWFQDDDWFKNP